MHFKRRSRCIARKCNALVSPEWFKSFGFCEFDDELLESEVVEGSEGARHGLLNHRRDKAMMLLLDVGQHIPLMLCDLFGASLKEFVQGSQTISLGQTSRKGFDPCVKVDCGDVANSPLIKRPLPRLHDRADESPSSDYDALDSEDDFTGDKGDAFLDSQREVSDDDFVTEATVFKKASSVITTPSSARQPRGHGGSASQEKARIRRLTSPPPPRSPTLCPAILLE